LRSGRTLPTLGNYKLYPQRWAVLFAASLLSLVNNIIWICFLSAEDSAEDYYDVDEDTLNYLSLTYLVTNVVLTLPAASYLDHSGIRRCTLISATFNLLGGWFRYGSELFPSGSRFWILLVGQGVASLSSPMYLSLPPKIAGVWFAEKERTIATAIVSLSQVLGIAGGYALGAVIVKSKDDIPLFLLVQAILTSVTFVVVFFGAFEKPPTSPSASAEGFIHPVSMKETLKEMWKDSRDFKVLLLCFCPGYGAAVATFSLMENILAPKGYSSATAGWYGVILILVGTLGAGVFGGVIDVTRKYRESMIVAFICAAASFGWFGLMVEPDNDIPLAFSCAAVGFFMLAMLPVCMEAGVEYTHPTPEATVAGVMMTLGSLCGVICLLVMEFLQEPDEGSMWKSLIFGFSVSVCCAGCTLFLRPNYKRLEYEKSVNYQLQSP